MCMRYSAMESWDRGTIKELPDVTVKSIEQKGMDKEETNTTRNITATQSSNGI